MDRMDRMTRDDTMSVYEKRVLCSNRGHKRHREMDAERRNLASFIILCILCILVRNRPCASPGVHTSPAWISR